MRPTSKTEEHIYQSVISGAIEVREDGSVWRLAHEQGNRWNNKTSLRPVDPYRIDGTLNGGYRLVKIMRNSKQVTTGAHRLVYRHFFGPIPEGLTINHKNGIRDDNQPENLELATYAEQMKHAIDVLGYKRKVPKGQDHCRALFSDDQIREIRRRRSSGEKSSVLAKDFGVSTKTICKITLRQRWKHIKGEE